MMTRRDLLVACVSISATVAVVALAQTASRPKMHSRVFDWAGMKARPTKTGEVRSVFDSPTANLTEFECHISTLNPGESPHPGHHHPEEELMIIKEDTLEAVQNGETNRVDQGGIIFEASNEYHSIRNIGATRATYYVLKWRPHDLGKGN